MDIGTVSLRQWLGVIVILFILFIVASAAFSPGVSISDGRLRLLVALAGGLLGLDGLRQVVIKHNGSGGGTTNGSDTD